ncbi:hypothetical protein SEA_ATUIN_228 [Arthrobacter phage Atuin]|nr:hypothetical protein SEA_ATUIN_27 [Arthrobacter phage Atuin]
MTEELKEVKYADVRVGDKLRRTETTEIGTVMITEGVVHQKDHRWADTKDDIALSFRYEEYGAKVVVVELLHRPEPKDHVVMRYVADVPSRLEDSILLTKEEADKKVDLLTRQASDTIQPFGKLTYKAIKLVGIE